jgi:predicted nucleic acid-binding protein
VALRLLDTNIVSFLFKKHILSFRYAPHLVGHELALSFMTPAEMWEGALRSNWSARRMARLRQVLNSYRLLESSPDVCQKWAEVRYERQAQPIAVDDAWIAATALVHGAELVTHNPADFRGISGLTIITESP